MYKNKKIAVVVPAYNEEKLIGGVIKNTPRFVDKIVVVDDGSKDKTAMVVKTLIKKIPRLVFIRHTQNEGVGAAIASGYIWCRDQAMDVAVVMAGDGQMLPEDLPAILDPVVEGRADYSKANRLLSGEAFQKIPRMRYLGNSALSFLTKIASGYWHVMDSQSGFTAINRTMLELIDWGKMYRRYGQPNDILVRLNVYNARVCDVISRPVYGVGERSRLRISRVCFTIPKILVTLFIWRLKEKYIIRDFHPLVLFYFSGLTLALISVLLMLRWIFFWAIDGEIPRITFLAWMLCVISSVQFTVFAMWFDMDSNRSLKA
jgi:glycosyltransferase involved in cell wall biosynthesis